MKRRVTSSAIATGSMAASSHADCAPWASGTSLPRQILQSYARYYNDIRTHRSLDKDAPVSRQIQRIGSIKSHAILGGLHHHYARTKVFGTHNLCYGTFVGFQAEV